MPRKPKAADQKVAAPSNAPAAQGEAENISGYFRQIFQDNPKLLQTRSNEELLKRWIADHPGNDEVPYRVKVGLQNVKSVLRSRGRKRKATRAAEAAAAAPPGTPPVPAVAVKKSSLEVLEVRIDDCLTTARTLDPDGLQSVISHLRRARNEVVWKLGQ